MSMSRAQLAAELWGRLGTQFTEAGITNIETTGNLKEPVDSTLLALGISYSDLATGTVADADIPRAIALASYFGYVKLIHAVAHTGTSRTISVGAPSVSKSENRADYIRSLERLRDAAKAEADDLSPGRGTWAFGDLSLRIYPSEAQ